MNKISSQQIQEVLAAVPETLRKLASERDYWRKEAQTRIHRDEAEKVAHELLHRLLARRHSLRCEVALQLLRRGGLTRLRRAAHDV